MSLVRELQIQDDFKFSFEEHSGEVTDQKAFNSTKSPPCLILLDTQILFVKKEQKCTELERAQFIYRIHAI